MIAVDYRLSVEASLSLSFSSQRTLLQVDWCINILCLNYSKKQSRLRMQWQSKEGVYLFKLSWSYYRFTQFLSLNRVMLWFVAIIFLSAFGMHGLTNCVWFLSLLAKYWRQQCWKFNMKMQRYAHFYIRHYIGYYEAKMKTKNLSTTSKLKGFGDLLMQYNT